MGVVGKLVNVFVLVFTVLIAVVLYNVCKEPPIPHLEDTVWGPRDLSDTGVKPFSININDEQIKDLQHRLENVRPFTPPLHGVQQQYGLNSDLMEEVIQYWRTQYNWREREKVLNKYPQFKTNIQGLNIHYIHVIPEARMGVKILPLILLHGWPGSVREFYDIIQLLTSPNKNYPFVFEVIAPSLPGFGFSDAAVRPGLGAAQVAVVMKNLMQRLGHDKYYVQGGDWGAIIGSIMATLFPQHIKGLHSNACFVITTMSMLKSMAGSLYPSLIMEAKYVDRMYPLTEKWQNTMLEMGYMHLQATKPDTIGFGLTDSPVGLAAYILEKFSTWTDQPNPLRADGGLTKSYTYADLLDNVMIYWWTNSMTTAMRLYAETFNKAHNALELDKLGITVQSACARFKSELAYQPDWILRDKYTKLVQVSDFDVGGHFAAMEQPKLLAEDVWNAIHKMEYFPM